MEHDLRVSRGDDLDYRRVADVRLDELNALPDLTQVAQPAPAQVVEHRDVMPFGQQSIHHGRADESCPAGDQ